MGPFGSATREALLILVLGAPVVLAVDYGVSWLSADFTTNPILIILLGTGLIFTAAIHWWRSYHRHRRARGDWYDS